jgi:hypothetical protein
MMIPGDSIYNYHFTIKMNDIDNVKHASSILQRLIDRNYISPRTYKSEDYHFLIGTNVENLHKYRMFSFLPNRDDLIVDPYNFPQIYFGFENGTLICCFECYRVDGDIPIRITFPVTEDVMFQYLDEMIENGFTLYNIDGC